MLLLGCPADNGPLKQENLQLKKQAAKLESVVLSLQEGNKVTQQQIDLLNRDARKTKEHYEEELKKAYDKIRGLSQGKTQEDTRVQTLEQENKKLRGDARWLRTQREQMRQGLHVHQQGGTTRTIEHPILKVIDAIHLSLEKNGYTILTSMKTDLKAVYLTDRKTSHPSSLELTGFRNQYVLSIEKKSPAQSKIWVRADFEKLSQNTHILETGESEIREIEQRLIEEIQHSLDNPEPPTRAAPSN